MARKVLVLGEVREGSLRNVSFEVNCCCQNGSRGRRSSWCFNWGNVSALGNEFIQYGADRVVVVENAKLAQYTSDGYAQALFAVIEQEKTRRNYFWSYSTWKDLSPRIGREIRFWFNF